MAPIIEVAGVTKQFPARRAVRTALGRGGLQDIMLGHRPEPFTALRDISFSIHAGESVGIIGRNGSGKSTLLKLIAGVTAPTHGVIQVNGRVASLLELGAGFHPMLTGRENIYLNGGLLGLRKKDVDGVFDSIVDFSGIGDFIDSPVETYSSGMYVRLGFAVAVHADPAIFLVDEVLAVGDEEFQRKCRARINELHDEGKTILFVSHDLGLVSALCDRVLLLNNGELVTRGTARETVNFYLRQVGSEAGIHILRDGKSEVILNSGRLALFYDGHEISSPLGFEVQLIQFKAFHNCQQADWRLVEQSDTHCIATGRMHRLPVVLHYTLRLRDGLVTWEIDVECEQDVEVEQIEVNCFLHTVYDRWMYGDQTGTFPELMPSDTEFAAVVASDQGVDAAAAFPRDAVLPPIEFQAQSESLRARLMWANTEYVLGSRVMHINAPIPSTDRPLKPGRHPFLRLQVRLDQSEAAIAEAVQVERSVFQGPVKARFYEGCVQFAVDDFALAFLPQLWTSLYINHLWHNSQSLRWDFVGRDGDAIVGEGTSRRLPFRQYWRIWPEENAIAVRIELECLQELSASEFHVSMTAPDAYQHWDTQHEQGAFPPFNPAQEDWVHLNQDYGPAESGKISGPGLPTITVNIDHALHPFRFTALNTGYSQQSRVLQALCAPDMGPFHWSVGRHLLFAGHIVLKP